MPAGPTGNQNQSTAAISDLKHSFNHDGHDLLVDQSATNTASA